MGVHFQRRAKTDASVMEEKHFTLKLENFKEICKSDSPTKDHSISLKIGNNMNFTSEWIFSLTLTLSADYISAVLKIVSKPANAKQLDFNCRVFIEGISDGVCLTRHGVLQEGETEWEFEPLMYEDEDVDFPLVDGSLFVKIIFQLYK